MHCKGAYFTVVFVVLAVTLSSLLPVVPVSGQSSRDETFIEEDIATNTVWSLSGSPYHVNTTVTVLAGATLEVQGGVIVKVEDWEQLIIQGTLIAKNVEFTSTSSSPSSGDWEGILFDSANQGNTVLDNIRVTYADTALAVQGSLVKVTNSRITKFSYYGIQVSDGGTINITNSWIESNDGDGIDCDGTLQASRDTIIGDYAVYAESSCTGFVDSSVLTANPSRGVLADPDATLVISNNVINSTYPDSSYGIYVNMGSKVVIRGDDIVGHLYCIYSESGFIRVEGVSLRNYNLYGISSEVPVTVKNSFAGRPKPTSTDKAPGDGNSKITFDAPLGAPTDIAGIEQPPSAAVTNYLSSSSVSGKVTLQGQAWDPDQGDSITKVEVRITNDQGSEVVQWTKVDGTGKWKYSWDTSKLAIGAYYINVKASNSKGEVSDPTYIFLVVNPYSSNGTNPYNSLVEMYMFMCIAGVIIIIVVVVVLVYYFVVRRKRAQPQQTYQPVYQPVYQPTYQPVYGSSYQAPYQYQPVAPQPAPQPAPVVPKEAPAIIEDVFLIYRDGRLIHHDTRRLRPEVDDQMLGGMFTAIQEFIGQSFPSEDGSKGIIKEIMYEDSKIILEHGQYVYLAVVSREIKDTAALHKRMSKLVKAIEVRCNEPLSDWDGTTDSVSEAKRMVKLMYSEEDIGMV
jgi:hypothetical protein